MGPDTHAIAPGVHLSPTGVRHLLSAAVDASPLAITCAEVADADGVVATLQRAGSATTRVVYRFDESPLQLLLEGDETPEELRGFAASIAGPVQALVVGLELTEAPAPPSPVSVTIDLSELEDLEHRMRTRLTVARGWVELLRTRRVDPASDLDPLAIASRQLGDIEDVLRTGLARARTTNLNGRNREELDLVVEVERILSESAWSLEPHVSGPLVTGDPRTVPLDRSDLRDVLLHLLDNATHHTPPRTEVAVFLTYRTGWVELAVKDAGPGLPDPANRPLGVGMQVVRRLAASMEAHLELDHSARLGGAAVRLLWPRGSPA